LPPAQARRQIESYIAEIESRLRGINALYSYGSEGAVKTLRTAFQASGINSAASVERATNWGNGILWLDWSRAREFYAYHLRALDASLNTARPIRYTVSNLAYLKSGMERWKAEEQRLQKLFQEVVRLRVEQSAVQEQKETVQRKWSDRVRQLSEVKPYPGDEIAKATKERDSESATLEKKNTEKYDAEVRVRAQIDEIATEKFFEALKASGCTPEGGARDIGATVKRVWQIPDPRGSVNVKVRSAVGYGEYAVEGADKALEDVANAISLIGEVVEKVPGGAVLKVPMKYFEKVAETGGAITSAGKRVSDRAQKQLVDVEITIDMKEISVDCVAQEICRTGNWTPTGSRKVAEQTLRTLPITKRVENVNLSERGLGQLANQNVQAYYAQQKAYESDPCRGIAAPTAIDGPDGNTEKVAEQCRELLENLRAVENEKKDLEVDLRNVERRLDGANVRLLRHRETIDKSREGLLSQLRQADQRKAKAEAELTRLNKRKDSLDANPNQPDERTWTSRLSEVTQKIAAAQAEVTAAKKDYADAEAERVKADQATFQLEQEVQAASQERETISKKIVQLQSTAEAIRQQRRERGCRPDR
jgi:predicted  nucleic acid-binding Zn-ribbon protein